VFSSLLQSQMIAFIFELCPIYPRHLFNHLTQPAWSFLQTSSSSRFLCHRAQKNSRSDGFRPRKRRRSHNSGFERVHVKQSTFSPPYGGERRYPHEWITLHSSNL